MDFYFNPGVFGIRANITAICPLLVDDDEPHVHKEESPHFSLNEDKVKCLLDHIEQLEKKKGIWEDDLKYVSAKRSQTIAILNLCDWDLVEAYNYYKRNLL